MLSFGKALFFVALSLATYCDLAAQSSIPTTFLKDAGHVAGGTGHILTAPLRWHGRDWANFGAVIGGTFALSFLDEEVNDYLQRHRSSTADKLADIGIEYGEPLTVVALTGVVYATGLLARQERLRETAVILSGALLPIGGIQTVAKRATGRARPHLGLGHDVFDPFRNEEAYYSFFSGHAMVAMATSHAFAKQFPHPVTKVAFYSLGALSSFARMYEEDHWLSDVVLGDVLAIVSVNSVAKWLAQQKQGPAQGSLQWRVFAQRTGIGMEVTW
jgi:membrane-associated phospholipid phosphatase